MGLLREVLSVLETWLEKAGKMNHNPTVKSRAVDLKNIVHIFTYTGLTPGFRECERYADHNSLPAFSDLFLSTYPQPVKKIEKHRNNR